MPEVIFSKNKNCKYEVLNHLYSGPVFIFGGFALGRFSQYFLKNFRCRPTMVADIFNQLPPTVKKLPTALNKPACI